MLLASALMLLAAGQAAAAGQPVQPTSGAEPLARDTRGRPTIPVRLNDRGPFPMVVDTAAQTSLIVPALATTLGVKPLDRTMGVDGATGGQGAPLFPIERFDSALFDLRRIAMIALPNSGVTEASGIVGMDMFADRRLVFDLAAKRLAVTASGPAPAGWASVGGEHVDAGFVAVPVRVENVAAMAVIDTGAAVTVANAAVLRALGWKDDDPRLHAAGGIRGATAQADPVRTAHIDRLTIGPVRLSNVTILVRSAASDPSAAPSLLLGDDLLNRLDAFAVDFPRAELQVRLPSAPRQP